MIGKQFTSRTEGNSHLFLLVTERPSSQGNPTESLHAGVHITTEFKAWDVISLHLGATGDRYAVSHHTLGCHRISVQMNRH